MNRREMKAANLMVYLKRINIIETILDYTLALRSLKGLFFKINISTYFLSKCMKKL